MNRSQTYIAIPPGETIKEQLSFRGMSQKEFAIKMGLTEKNFSSSEKSDYALLAWVQNGIYNTDSLKLFAEQIGIGISALPGMDSAGAISMRLLDVQNHSDEEFADIADKIEILRQKYSVLFANERVEAIEGDITNEQTFDALISYPFKTLINCAACVKHFAASDILTQINVEGVQNLINLCVKKKARLIQISTVSIAGDNVDQKIPMGTKLAENDFYIGQNVTSNKYVYSKFQAEEIVLAAVGQGELDAKIMRVGNLMRRVSDGEFQINFMTNAFMRDEKKFTRLQSDSL